MLTVLCVTVTNNTNLFHYLDLPIYVLVDVYTLNRELCDKTPCPRVDAEHL